MLTAESEQTRAAHNLSVLLKELKNYSDVMHIFNAPASFEALLILIGVLPALIKIQSKQCCLRRPEPHKTGKSMKQNSCLMGMKTGESSATFGHMAQSYMNTFCIDSSDNCIVRFRHCT